MGDGGRIVLPNGEISVDADGTISVDGSQAGKFRLVAFSNKDNLIKEGDSLFMWAGEGVNSRQPYQGETKQGYLEASNVNPVREMVQMIEAIRTYEGQQKMIQTFDEIEKKVIDEVGSLR
jgi:flagellar basal-body rod protein FlgG